MTEGTRLELWQAKLVAMIGLLCAMFFATLLPLCVRSFFKSANGKGKVVISYLSVFGGGIFLAIYLLILAPEVQTLLTLTLVEPYNLHYPVPELFVAAGFFLMVIVAKLLHTLEARYGGKSPKNYMLLLIALSLTNVLEGLSIGFQRTNKGVWNLVLAILIMDSVVSFCMGLQMITDTGYENDYLLQKVKHREEDSGSGGESGEHTELKNEEDEGKSYGTAEADAPLEKSSSPPKKQRGLGSEKIFEVVISAFVYSAMTSLGITIGTLVIHFTEEGHAVNLANGVLQAIAAGTFLYTTFFEVLFGEIEANSPVTKLLAFMAGFVMIALLNITEDAMIEKAVQELHINSTTILPPDPTTNATTTPFFTEPPVTSN